MGESFADMIAQDDSRRAFGAGCDSRLAGLPESDNPFLEEDPNRGYWKRGWSDVNNHWGEGAWRFPQYEVKNLVPISPVQ